MGKKDIRVFEFEEELNDIVMALQALGEFDLAKQLEDDHKQGFPALKQALTDIRDRANLEEDDVSIALNKFDEAVIKALNILYETER